MMASFMLDGMPINAAFQSALSNDIVIEHPELWALYPGRSNLLCVEGNFNSNRYVREVLQSEVVPFLQSTP